MRLHTGASCTDQTQPGPGEAPTEERAPPLLVLLARLGSDSHLPSAGRHNYAIMHWAQRFLFSLIMQVPLHEIG